MREWGGCEWGVKTESERERNGLKGKKDNKTNKNTHPLAAWSVLINFLIFHCSTALSVSEEFSDILRQEEKGSERERGRRGRDGLLAREQRTMRKNESTFFFFPLFSLPIPPSLPSFLSLHSPHICSCAPSSLHSTMSPPSLSTSPAPPSLLTHCICFPKHHPPRNFPVSQLRAVSWMLIHVNAIYYISNIAFK